MAATVWNLGGLRPVEFLKQVGRQAQRDDVVGHAAELSYYFLLALFPFLLFLVSLLGFFAGEGSTLRDTLMGYFSQVLPGEAHGIVQGTLTEVVQKNHGGILSLGIIAALWAASNGMGALIKTLNVTYGVKETRPWWKARAIAIGLTVALSVFVILSLAAVLMGDWLASYLAQTLNMNVLATVWQLLRWPLVIALVFVAFGWVYLFAPNFQESRWYWVAPGAAVGVALWLIASYGFSLYLQYGGNYSSVYGSLGAVVILMVWFYLSSLAILLGGEVNAVIENAAAERGDRSARSAEQEQPQETRRREQPEVRRVA